MFGRRSSPDSDASAVARRRLAALAAQFEANASVPAALGQRESLAGARTATPITTPGQHNVSAAGAEELDSSGLAQLDPAGHGPAGKASSSSGSAPGRHAARKIADEYGRWSLSAHQVTVVALIVAAVVALAGWWVLRSVPHPAPVEITSERSLPATASVPLSPSASPVVAPTGGALVSTVDAAADSARLIVDVAGKVRRPGIVELPTGSRVVDALRAAGGARSGVDTTALNLARPLIDGEQIVVGLRVPAVDLAPSPGISGGVTSGAVASIDLNAASQEQLETLPGIGPVTATSILAWRTENGAFTSVDELLEVSGIGEVTLTGIEDYVHV